MPCALARLLEYYRSACRDSDEAIAHTYVTCAHTIKQIGGPIRVHCMTIRRAAHRHRQNTNPRTRSSDTGLCNGPDQRSVGMLELTPLPLLNGPGVRAGDPRLKQGGARAGKRCYTTAVASSSTMMSGCHNRETPSSVAVGRHPASARRSP